MASKAETLDFLSKAIDLEGKEIIAALNELLDKSLNSRIKDILRSLRDDAMQHKQTLQGMKNEVLAGDKNEY